MTKLTAPNWIFASRTEKLGERQDDSTHQKPCVVHCRPHRERIRIARSAQGQNCFAVAALRIRFACSRSKAEARPAIPVRFLEGCRFRPSQLAYSPEISH